MSQVVPEVRLVSDTLTDAQVLVGPDADADPSENAAFIAFRGTTTRADWNINSRLWLIPSPLCERACVHSGFAMQWESVRSRVFEIVEELEPLSLLITGHSLGGALATVASADIVTRYPDMEVEVITFGAPRCGNMAYMEAVATIVPKLTRVVHDSDAVPSTPPLFMTYSHCSGEWVHIHYKSALGGKRTEVVWRKGADLWWREAQMLWRRVCQREFGVADHYIERYLEALVKASASKPSRGGEPVSAEPEEPPHGGESVSAEPEEPPHGGESVSAEPEEPPRGGERSEAGGR